MNTVISNLVSLHIGKARQIEPCGSDEWWDKPWKTGFLKEPRLEPTWLGYEGFRGDEQADRRFHGGADKAVCAYFSEHYPYWRDVLSLPDLGYGAFGENVTIQGIVEDDVCIGDRFSLGDAEVQISQPRQPCWKLARRWHVKDLAARVEKNGFTGFYFRVLRHGIVRPEDALVVVDRTFPEWTVGRCNEVMHHSKSDAEAMRALSQCQLLSASWKDALWLRSTKVSPAATSELRNGQPE